MPAQTAYELAAARRRPALKSAAAPITCGNLVNRVKFLGLAHTFATVSPSNIENIVTRRNGLVDQVKFFGLAHTFATVSPSNILRQTLSRDTSFLLF